MAAPFAHALLPEPTHDEWARQSFAQAMRQACTVTLAPGNSEVYRARIQPALRRALGRDPHTRHEVSRALLAEPYYQYWSALQRTTQEMLWDGVGETVERQLPTLIARARAEPGPGTLRLDPAFVTPRYMAEVDIHVMPGNYQSELVADDVFAGAIYDRGVYLYGMGALGPTSAGYGEALIGYLRERFPEFEPHRILDLGCSVGHSTVPWAQAFANAEVHAIDIGAPMLRYAHARARALGAAVHFSQQNAETTDFSVRSFDLVVSHILLHELPAPALRRVLRECRRLLRTGGLMLHLDGLAYGGRDPFEQAVQDWNTHFNNEPFQGASHDFPFTEEAIKSGFDRGGIIVEDLAIPRAGGGHRFLSLRGARA
ncbi:MAG: class I SAM-dependent methyltransferase [Alphaproteobacteria bacterium]|nr:class I SAM-dependent methyltransferase [Alphaproteobacteria bacterium]